MIEFILKWLDFKEVFQGVVHWLLRKAQCCQVESLSLSFGDMFRFCDVLRVSEGEGWGIREKTLYIPLSQSQNMKYKYNKSISYTLAIPKASGSNAGKKNTQYAKLLHIYK